MSAKKADVRAEKPVNFWTKAAPDYSLGQDRWRVYVRRGDGKTTLRVDDVVETITWEDVSAVRTGTISLRRPASGKLDIYEGYQVVLQWAHGNSAFKELWRMRLAEPQSTASDGGLTFQLIDDLQYLQIGREDFHYHKDKQHPKGWLVHDIVRDICRRFGIGVGRLVRTTTRIQRMTKRCSPLEAIIYALRKEKDATGRKLIISSTGGKLNVDPLRRSQYLLLLGGKLAEAAYTRTVLKEGFASEITVTGSRKVKGKHRKLRVTVRSQNGIKRYGRVHKFIDAGDADSLAEARKAGKRALAAAAKPKQSLSLSMPGIPGLHRGAALLANLPDEGVKQVVYVTEVRHSVSGTDYTMDVEVNFDDPYTALDKPAKTPKSKKAGVRGDDAGSLVGEAVAA